MDLIIFLASGALALLVLAAAIGMIGLSDNVFAARLGRVQRGARSEAAESTKVKVAKELQKLGARLGKGAIDGANRKPVRLKLIQAGFHSDRAVEVFYAMRVLTALAFGLAAVLGAVLLRTPGSLGVLLSVMTAAAVGLYAPNLVLAVRQSQRNWAMKIGLPDAVDLMVVCVEAGGTLTTAMQRVSREFRELHPVIAEHFDIVLVEMQAGSSRAEALQRFMERAPVEEVRSMVTLLVQSEALGASVGQTLRAFAEEMRRSRYLTAERKAAELPVKLAIPLVLGIFPALATVIFTPLIIRIFRVLLQGT